MIRSTLKSMRNVMGSLKRPFSKQLCSFLHPNHILEVFQSGFRPFHNTETAMVKVLNDLLLASDSGYISVLMLLDLSAAFDTVDHLILLDQLENLVGIRLTLGSDHTYQIDINLLILTILTLINLGLDMEYHKGLCLDLCSSLSICFPWD